MDFDSLDCRFPSHVDFHWNQSQKSCGFPEHAASTRAERGPVDAIAPTATMAMIAFTIVLVSIKHYLSRLKDIRNAHFKGPLCKLLT